MPLTPLPPQDLCRRCDPGRFAFATTAELQEVEGPLGQERAAEALRFGLDIRREGYNVFALGPPGVGKQTLVSRAVAEHASGEKVPPDWVYLANFENRARPRAVHLPPGRGIAFRDDMQKLVEELRAAIPAVFESEEYRTRLQVLEKQLEERREKAMRAVREHAQARAVAVIRTPMGLALAPTKDGEVLDPEQFRKLPEEEQARIQKEIGALQEELQTMIRALPQLERDHREKVKEMNREVALYAAGHLVDEVRKRYADLPAVIAHLDAVQRDVVENVHDFIGSAEPEDAAGQIRKLLAETPTLHRYGVNVIVDNAATKGAPIVLEDLPTHSNLVGRIEYHSHFGSMVTDFTLLRPGALHRANGGYLLLDARRVLMQPFAWEDLKRALRAREIRIEPPERLLGLSGTASLEPEPIPLDVKVVLVGERLLYHLLAEYDPEFLELFKIAADFEEEIDRGEGSELRLRPPRRDARPRRRRSDPSTARRWRASSSSRRASPGTARSSPRTSRASRTCVREADQCSADAKREVVTRADVQAAIDGQDPPLRPGPAAHLRGDRPRHDPHRHGGRAGGPGERPLGRDQLGQFAFGRPSRITARVRLGKGEVVDIEREVELGGPIHSKGVLILAGFLGARYAERSPLHALGEPGLRAVVRRRRGRQRLLRRAVRAALGPLRVAHPADAGGDGIRGPARPGPGRRRGQREGRGLLRRLPRPRSRRVGGRARPGVEREAPHAAVRRGRGGGPGPLPRLRGRDRRPGHRALDGGGRGRAASRWDLARGHGQRPRGGSAGGPRGEGPGLLGEGREGGRPVTSRQEGALRRILVALDASRTSLDALRGAATLAARLGAELAGLFVEDENLLRLSGLPVARQLSVHGGTGRPVAEIEGELRALAARAREAVAAAAAPHRISWSFRVARGQVAVEVVSAAGEADLLVVGWAGHRVAGRRGPGETARAAAARAPTPVLILTRDVEVGRPLLVAWDGSPGAAGALDLAARLEAAGLGAVTLLLVAPDPPASARLLDDARRRLGRSEPPPSRYAGPRPADVLRAAAGPGALLVLGAGSALLGGPGGLEAFLDEVSCPVLLAR